MRAGVAEIPGISAGSAREIDLCPRANSRRHKARSVIEGKRFPVASLDDIIASKRATGREKDVADVRRLEQFRIEYQRRHEQP